MKDDRRYTCGNGIGGSIGGINGDGYGWGFGNSNNAGGGEGGDLRGGGWGCGGIDSLKNYKLRSHDEK